MFSLPGCKTEDLLDRIPKSCRLAISINIIAWECLTSHADRLRRIRPGNAVLKRSCRQLIAKTRFDALKALEQALTELRYHVMRGDPMSDILRKLDAALEECQRDRNALVVQYVRNME